MPAPPMFQELSSQVLVGVPVGIANSGTVTAAGQITLGTALPASFTGGIWLYYPATAFSALAAGFYWTVMTSSTVGTVYSTALTSGIPSVPTGTLVAAVGTGAGYTGATTAQTVTIPLNPNVLGAVGYARLTAAFGFTNNADNKTTAIAIGGTTVYTSTNASIAGQVAQVHLFNQASQAVNTASPSAANPFTAGALQYTTITFASPTGVTPPNLTVALTLATATDSLVMNGLFAEFFYGQ